jgi:hypothetical protein
VDLTQIKIEATEYVVKWTFLLGIFSFFDVKLGLAMINFWNLALRMFGLATASKFFVIIVTIISPLGGLEIAMLVAMLCFSVPLVGFGFFIKCAIRRKI